MLEGVNQKFIYKNVKENRRYPKADPKNKVKRDAGAGSYIPVEKLLFLYKKIIESKPANPQYAKQFNLAEKIVVNEIKRIEIDAMPLPRDKSIIIQQPGGIIDSNMTYRIKKTYRDDSEYAPGAIMEKLI